MRISDRVVHKPRRPTRTSRDKHITARFPDWLIECVDAWASAQNTGRSDAFRRLVVLGLKEKLGSEWIYSRGHQGRLGAEE